MSMVIVSRKTSHFIDATNIRLTIAIIPRPTIKKGSAKGNRTINQRPSERTILDGAQNNSSLDIHITQEAP